MTTVEQPHLLFRVLPQAELDNLLNPDHPSCPFYGYVGNREAVEAMLDIAYPSFAETGEWEGNPVSNRQCRARVRIEGPPSAGKTTLAKRFGKLMKLPFVATDPTLVKTVEALFDLIVNAYKEVSLDFEPVGKRGSIQLYEAPPTIVFIDEIHLMPGKVQDAFLTATESNDNMLRMNGREVDCTEVCFILGTTDCGKLRPAFRTRFQPITLRRHTSAEVAQIVRLEVPKLPTKVCDRIADLLPIPREAVRFAKTVEMSAARRRLTLEKAVELIAEREGIQEGGISQIGVKALKALDESDGLSKKNLCSTVGIEMEEWENIVLPTLLATDRHSAYVVVASRHQITDEGRQFLKTCR